MNPSQVLLVLRPRRWIILITLLCTVVTTLVVSLLLPKSYKATTTLVLNYKGVDSVTGTTIPAQLMPGYMATQVDILNSKSVALKVVDELKLANNETVKADFAKSNNGEGDIRDWLAGLLLKNLEAVPSRESSVLTISFTGADPRFAAAIANAFARAYQRTAIQLKVEPLKRASSYFNEQVKVLRDHLETAQNNLSRYQQEKGIVSIDNRLDVETSRLNDLSTQLVVVQGQRMDASSRQRQTQVGAGGDSPDVMSSPLIQNLKSSISQAEASLSEISQRLGENHPQYQGGKAELDKLKTQLKLHVNSATSALYGNAHILTRRENEVRVALQAQKEKVLQLNVARDELALLTREVDSAQRAYDASMQRFNQTSLEGQANQTDVAVLTEAAPPAKASSPNVMMNTVTSVFLGLLLGLMFGLLAEFMDRRLRCADNFVEALDAPVLATLSWSPPKRKGLAGRLLSLGTRLQAN
jgi:succinoglycan biosynthesis transport protein ExoP